MTAQSVSAVNTSLVCALAGCYDNHPERPIFLTDMNQEIARLIQQFVSGTDCSIDTANKIELILDASFPEDDYLQETVEMLAMYRPEGGEFLFDTTAIRRRLIERMEHLQKSA